MEKLFILFLFFAGSASAQIDSVIQLKDVNVSEIRAKYQSGLHKEVSDSNSIQRLNTLTFDKLLQENSAICIKEYGPGQLSTITLRGGSAYHTAVLWNGLSIASPLHGLADLTLIDNLFFDQASVLYGGSSTIWGSGAVSGSVSLDNIPHFNSGLSLTGGLSAGSYSDLRYFSALSFGKKKYYGCIKYLGNNNLNNYEYYEGNYELRNQINSRIVHHSLFTDHYFRTGNNSVLSIKLWWTFYDRLIPPGLQQANSHALQVDHNLRSIAEWKKVSDSFRLIARAAWFEEREKYKDDFLVAPSNNNCNTLTAEASVERFFNHHEIEAGISNSVNLVDSSANLRSLSLNRTAFFLLYRYVSANKKLDGTFSIRKEISGAGDSPFLYATGINYRLNREIVVRTSASRVFRYPTINDLYWSPGGNVSLKPENGWNYETGIEFERVNSKKTKRLTAGITAFYKYMDDWIIWYPSNGNLWKPQNLMQVRSRGIETMGRCNFSWKKISGGISVKYNYTVSTNEKSLRPADESYKKQLIYVPEHMAAVSANVNYKLFAFNSNVQYTGRRYTTSDNTSWLDDYFIVNAEASQRFTVGSCGVKAFIRMNNVLNTNYQSVENRPMPLRTIVIGISITYRKSES